MDLGLKGKRAAVTGGSRGIGRAIVELLLAEGAEVAFCARGEDGVRTAEAAFASKGKAAGSAVDAGDAAAVEAWVASSAAAMGGLDIVVANVSAMDTRNTAEAWRKSVEIDILGTVALCAAAWPHLEKTAGAVVVIGSVAGVEVSGPTQPYRSVKAALLPYVKSMAIDGAPKGVRINCVSPGTIYFEGGVWHKRELNDPKGFKAAVDRNPTGRMGTPQEVANAAVFLASPAASFITGVNLLVDGAVTRRIN